MNNYKISEEDRNKLLSLIINLTKEEASLKQALRQQGENNRSEKEQIFLELLEVFDTLESLLNYLEYRHEPDDRVGKRLPKSLKSVQTKLLSILEKRQVLKIELSADQPDFTICQVVAREIRPDLEEQTITKIVRQGFTIEDKLLRPMEVITSKQE
ncbi:MULTISPECIES: nucleotide exchange factor GrpE [Microcystis]|jgi:molecular chaperone GrpE|uniref:Nucleotide exchange factor GrpE n=2 Tax=Microcystis TaxID=1125 RepID=A0ABR8HML5_9CHRO|nr:MULTISPECIES: nucleotide exchange factor GrpE [Microcystis]MBD2287730.1 nucleotide exchange factor GrpE [Microcystis wesenbergii FACHB-1317]MBD2620663.1 nucleotide exchange factor GrpE [Microcystis flos-aquae FACHB-1344]MCA2702384.1 nucleotide exchange factor GrpE [Microcystis sp. M179S2]MCZ8117429.1 nucleotide exchange factor GrpE [Microcystis sp. LE18-22.4A]MCZ8250521.1 nucleotide exchange factor GrpE [Microcystis sp. LE19-195.1E]